MKLFCGFILLVSVLFVCSGQQSSFPLYFEDTLGNKDTLYFGFDPSANRGIDEQLGELNVLGEPFDTTLSAFFTDAVCKDYYMDCSIESERAPSFLSKKQYVKNEFPFFIETGIFISHWPLTISWDQNRIKTYEQDYYGDGMHMIITGWHPPGGWFDAASCGSGWPDNFTTLSDTSKIEVEMSNFCQYHVDFSEAPAYLLYIGFQEYTPVVDIEPGNSAVQCWFDQPSGSVRFSHLDKDCQMLLELFDLQGRKVLEEQVRPDSQQISYRLGSQFNGFYVVRLREAVNGGVISAHKLLIN